MLPEPLVVRQATVDDIPFMRAMMEEAYRASPALLAHVDMAEIQRYEEQVWQAWRERPGPAFIAEDGAGRRLGAIRCEPYASEDGQGWQFGIGVETDARGRGIGRRLIERTIAAARASNVHDLYLIVDPTNAPAIALYRRLGFVEIGERDGGVEMRLNLGEHAS